MLADWFKNSLQFFLQISKENRAFLILLILAILNINVSNINVVNRLISKERLEKMEAERYTERITPTINTQIQYILMSDPDATNVILLNYHNNNHSSQGFSYKYITFLSEKFKDDEPMWGEEFRELSYINYGEELIKIHNLRYLRADSIDELRESFPKLYRKIRLCNASAVAFYPIEGVRDPVGMVIVLYKTKPQYNLGYYMKTVSPRIQRLAILLDYNQVKKQMEN